MQSSSLKSSSYHTSSQTAHHPRPFLTRFWPVLWNAGACWGNVQQSENSLGHASGLFTGQAHEVQCVPHPLVTALGSAGKHEGLVLVRSQVFPISESLRAAQFWETGWMSGATPPAGVSDRPPLMFICSIKQHGSHYSTPWTETTRVFNIRPSSVPSSSSWTHREHINTHLGENVFVYWIISF